MLLCRAFEACSWAANHTRLRLQTSRAVQQAHPLPTRGVSTAAAANAAAIYAATAEMQDILSGMREYYCSTETGRHGLPTPTTADLSAVVVGVSRLVQIEWGAQHGWGECHLRDQVMRLLHGLLSVEDCSVIGSERPMSGGRSDLVVYSLEGSALLVVEYKQRHSGAASTHQQQDTMQLRRYLSDSRCGCDEGLLITFDKALPNGLSATRVTRVTDIHAWAQLYNDSPRNAPAFATQPMHGLESDPLAVGVMMGLCQAYGVVVVPANITR